MNKEEEQLENTCNNHETETFVNNVLSSEYNQEETESHKRPSPSNENSSSKKTKITETASSSFLSEHVLSFWLDPRKNTNAKVKKDFSKENMEKLVLCNPPIEIVKSHYLHPYPAVLFPFYINPDTITLEICERRAKNSTCESIETFAGSEVIRWYETQYGFVAVAFGARLSKEVKVYAKNDYFMCFTAKYQHNPEIVLTAELFPTKIRSKRTERAPQAQSPITMLKKRYPYCDPQFPSVNTPRNNWSQILRGEVPKEIPANELPINSLSPPPINLNSN